MRMSTAVAVVLFVAVTAYAVFGGADFGAGFWDLVAGGTDARRAAPRGDRPLDRPGVGGQPRLADLLLRRAVDRLPRGLRLDHPHAVRPAHASPRSASCCGARASPSARRCSAPATGATSAPPSPSRRCSSRTAWARSPARIASGGCRPAARPATRGQLGQPDVDPRRRARRRRRRLPRRRLPRLGRPPAGRRGDGRVLPPPGRRRRRRRRRRGRRRHLRAAAPTPGTCSTG